MKANEIQIGDYLFVAKDNLCIRKGTIVEIRGIDADDKLEGKNLIGSTHCRPLDKDQFEGGIWLDYLEPIPLTPEILEENGFKKEGSWFIIEDDYYDVSIREITDSIWRVKYCNTEFSAFDSVLHIAFIHELQHALRLCGISKEIVL